MHGQPDQIALVEAEEGGVLCAVVRNGSHHLPDWSTPCYLLDKTTTTDQFWSPGANTMSNTR